MKLRSPPRSLIFLLFDPEHRFQIPSEFPSTAALLKYTAGGKYCDFRLKSPFILETVEIGPWLLWDVNWKSYVTDRSVSVLMTLSDLERRENRSNFQADLLNNARTV